MADRLLDPGAGDLLAMDRFIRDIRLTFRALTGQPGSTFFALVSLVTVFGSLVAAFTIMDRALIRTLPVPEPGELWVPRWQAASEFPAESLAGSVDFAEGGPTSTSFSLPAWERFRAGVPAMNRVVAFASIERINAAWSERSMTVSGHSVSGNFFSFFSIRPQAGRFLDDSDDQPGSVPAVVLSDHFWRTGFGGRDGVVGSGLRLNGAPFTVVGIAPPGFNGAIELERAPDVFVTLTGHSLLQHDPSVMTNDGHWWVQLLGATRDPGRAAAEMGALLRGMIQERRPDDPEAAEIRVQLDPGSRGLSESRVAYRTPLYLLGGILGALFLIACMNIASLFLARAMRRQRDIATRMALGSSRIAIARQLVVESTCLTIVGAAGGLAIAPAMSAVMLRVLPRSQGRIAIETSLDGRVVLFALGVALLSGLVIGLLPSIRTTRITASQLIGHRVTARRSRMAKVMVSVQVALSVALLVASALLVQSLRRLDRIDLGFDPGNVVQFRLSNRSPGASESATLDLGMRVRESIRALPGVETVSLSSHGVLSGGSMMKSIGDDGDFSSLRDRYVLINAVDPAFLRTMGIRLMEGRGIEEGDGAGQPLVAVINETAAKTRLHGEEPIGATLLLSGTVHTVVGVVKDAKYIGVRTEPQPVAYLPLAQLEDSLGSVTLDVRTTAAPEALVPMLREAVRTLDPDTPVFDLATQEELVARWTLQERAIARLAAGFGVLAALLAAIGLYGLMSFLVASRTMETGVRMALGAERLDIVRHLIRESLAIVLPGIAIGIPVTLVGGRLLREILYEVSPNDPGSTVVAVVLMVSVSVIASAIPAWRAATTDPVVALRSE